MLFRPPVDPHSFFEKQASIAKMPDDDMKWPAHVLSNLHQQLPFLSQYEVDLDLQRVEPEAGFAFGHAMLMARNDPSAATSAKNPQNMVRIPIIVADRLLQPFHTFELGGNVYPLTSDRIEEALINPAIFQGPANPRRSEKSLVDQMQPPYQQRQGFGRTVEDAGAKTASAPLTQFSRAITKMAAVSLKFDGSAKIPASVVLKDAKVHLAGGTNPASLSFFQVPGTSYVVAVPPTVGARLEKMKDQAEMRKALVPLMREEMAGSRSGSSKGMFLLFSRGADGKYVHITPPRS